MDDDDGDDGRNSRKRTIADESIIIGKCDSDY
jgi:hypothetical protein